MSKHRVSPRALCWWLLTRLHAAIRNEATSFRCFPTGRAIRCFTRISCGIAPIVQAIGRATPPFRLPDIIHRRLRVIIRTDSNHSTRASSSTITRSPIARVRSTRLRPSTRCASCFTLPRHRSPLVPRFLLLARHFGSEVFLRPQVVSGQFPQVVDLRPSSCGSRTRGSYCTSKTTQA